MPKLYEYFGLVFLFYSDDHDPLHLHVQRGEREGIIMLMMVEGILTELRWRTKRLTRSVIFRTLILHIHK